MWTAENRGRYDHKTKRYPSDLTDEEWALVEPHLPPPTKGRRHPALDRREVMNAILYVLTTGCQWRQLPRDFPSKTAVHKYLIGLQHDGVLTRIHDALYGKVREEAGKAPTPTLSIIDSQSVKSAEKGGATLIRMATMRQENQGQEAPHRCRYTRTDARPHGAARRHPGSRRGPLSAEDSDSQDADLAARRG